MKEKEYLQLLTKRIANGNKRKEIYQELQNHINDQREAYVREGYTAEKAEMLAIKDMGDPTSVGKELNTIHPPTINRIQPIMFTVIAIALVFLRRTLQLGGWDFTTFAPIDILQISGAFFCFYGIIVISYERYLDLPFFYGRSQRGGSNANGVTIGAIGVAMVAHSISEGIILIFVFNVVIISACIYMERKRARKEKKYLWEIGIVSDDFTYKGKAIFKGEPVTVFTLGESIKTGAEVIIVGINGFQLIVELNES